MAWEGPRAGWNSARLWSSSLPSPAAAAPHRSWPLSLPRRRTPAARPLAHRRLCVAQRSPPHSKGGRESRISRNGGSALLRSGGFGPCHEFGGPGCGPPPLRRSQKSSVITTLTTTRATTPPNRKYPVSPGRPRNPVAGVGAEEVKAMVWPTAAPVTLRFPVDGVTV